MERRLYRSYNNRMLGGVCAGLGEYFNTDPSLVRIVFVLLLVFGGSGFLLYLILWVILPEQGRSYASPEDTTRANTYEIVDQARQIGQNVQSGNPTWIFGLILIVVGGIFLLERLVPSFSFWTYWPVILIGIGLVMLFAQTRK